MKCSIQGCTGEYEPKTITHTARHHGNVVVFDCVPVEICDVCGDTLLADNTVQKLENMLKNKRPVKTVPLYEYV